MTPAAIAAGLARFIHKEQFTELRALNVGQRGRCFAGWFDGRHLADLARSALALTRQATGVYFVPNPVDPALAAKRLNQVLNVPRGFGLTHDADVLQRRYLIVDLDPVRYTEAAGRERPTSARELVFARRVADRHVRPFLRSAGYGEPLVMVSGNGIHLAYRLSSPVPAGLPGADPLACVLALLAERFTCLGVTIDPNTYNPCRMLKVPGTLSRKGEPGHDRPHRPARIIEVPDGWREPEPPPRGGEPTERPPARVGRAPAAPVADPARLFDPGRPGSDGRPVH